VAAESSVFDQVCEALEARTSLERIEARGTVRIALKQSGLDPSSVDGAQLAVVLRKVLPSELDMRGVADSEATCETMAQEIESLSGSGGDRASAAADTFGRFGS
jgi:hypothetical protein